MAGSLSFYLSFDDSLVAESLYSDLAAFLTRPVPVRQKQVVALQSADATADRAPTGTRMVTCALEEGVTLSALVGENLFLSEANGGLRLASKIDGFFAYDGEQLLVTPFVEVFGDVGPLTGDIIVDAAIRVYGGVMTGYKLSSRQNIEILGLVEGATIETEGSIMLRGGMAGAGEGRAVAGKSIAASFVQQGTLEAGESIIVDGMAMESNLAATQTITVKGKGALVGGCARARERITASVIGSEGAAPTELKLGFDPFISTRRESLADQRDTLIRDVDTRQREVSFAAQKVEGVVRLREQGPLVDLFRLTDLARSDAPDRMEEGAHRHFEEVALSLLALVPLQERLERVKEKLTQLEDDLFQRAEVRVARVVHPGVTVMIGRNSRTLHHEYERARIRLLENEIDIS